MAQHKATIDLRSVIYREGTFWIAHCLELDIAAQGRTRDEAVRNMVELCDFQVQTAIEDGDLEPIFRPAPSRFWRLYFSATRARKAPRTFSAPLRRIETREMVPA